MRDNRDRKIRLIPDGQQCRYEVASGSRIETRERLIQNQHPWPTRQDAGDRYSALLTTTQRIDAAVGKPAG